MKKFDFLKKICYNNYTNKTISAKATPPRTFSTAPAQQIQVFCNCSNQKPNCLEYIGPQLSRQQHLTVNQRVEGSSPSSPAWRISPLLRGFSRKFLVNINCGRFGGVVEWQTRQSQELVPCACGFESHRPHSNNKSWLNSCFEETTSLIEPCLATTSQYKLHHMGGRQSWRAAADCKSVPYG